MQGVETLAKIATKAAEIAFSSSPKVPKTARASFWNATPRKHQNSQNCSGAAQA